MKKKILNVQKQADGRLLILSDSYPVEYTLEIVLEVENHKDTMIAVPENFEWPPILPGKKRFVYWNAENEVAEAEYIDKTFDEMDVHEQNAFLRAENASFREELELTQAALFELHAMVVGGNEDGSN